MVPEQAADVRRISAAARELARGAERPNNSVHLVLAMFISRCSARDLLEEAGADHATTLESYRQLRVRNESPRAWAEVWTSAAGLAESSGLGAIDSTCLLAGLLRVREALAAKVLRGAGIDVIQLRTRVIGQLTLQLDRAGGRRGRRRRSSETQAARPLPIELVGPSRLQRLGLDRRGGRLRPNQLESHLTGTSGRDFGARSAIRPRARAAQPDNSGLWHRGTTDADSLGATQPPNTGQHPRAAPPMDAAYRIDDVEAPPSDNAVSLRPLPLPTGLMRAVQARESGEVRRRGRASTESAAHQTAPTSIPSIAAAVARGSDVEAPSAVLSHRGNADVAVTSGAISTATSAATDLPLGHALQITPQAPTAAPPQFTSRGVFNLDPARYPVLVELGRNLTVAALDGEIQPLIGRHDLVDSIIDVLMMRQVNNPCLVGEAGVGKTAIVEGLARRLAGNRDRYGRLGEAVIIELSVSSLLAGTSFRGAFSQRMQALRDEVASANGHVIVFMDEIHTLMGAGAGEGPLDAANDLKTALARGKFPLIGATTQAEYRRHIEKDPAMERRLQVITVPEPSVEEAITILGGVAPIYARHHGLAYCHDAVVSAVHLSKRFITDRCLPDKAIAVLDRAGAQARRRGKTRVEADDVSRAVHQLTQVPLGRLLADERSRIRDLGAELQGRIFGHDQAMERVARRVQRNYAGFAAERPLASLLFVGTPGTGKTAAAYALSETLFLVDDALVRFDMTEYADNHTVSRLIGSPPGYVGHQQPGLLSQAIHKRPYRVLLFDDIDRAAPEIVALILQIVDTGQITDNQGNKLDLRNAIIVMTSTVPVAALRDSVRSSIGFGRSEEVAVDDDDTVLQRIRGRLGVELWGRVDDKILFRPLSEQALRAVAQRCIEASLTRLYESRLVRVHFQASVIDLLLRNGGVDPELGVRPLRGEVERLIEAFLTDRVLEGSLQPGAEMQLTVVDGQLSLVAMVAALVAPEVMPAEVITAEEDTAEEIAVVQEIPPVQVPASQPTAPTQMASRGRP